MSGIVIGVLAFVALIAFGAFVYLRKPKWEPKWVSKLRSTPKLEGFRSSRSITVELEMMDNDMTKDEKESKGKEVEEDVPVDGGQNNALVYDMQNVQDPEYSGGESSGQASNSKGEEGKEGKETELEERREDKEVPTGDKEQPKEENKEIEQPKENNEQAQTEAQNEQEVAVTSPEVLEVAEDKEISLL